MNKGSELLNDFFLSHLTVWLCNHPHIWHTQLKIAWLIRSKAGLEARPSVSTALYDFPIKLPVLLALGQSGIFLKTDQKQNSIIKRHLTKIQGSKPRSAARSFWCRARHFTSWASVSSSLKWGSINRWAFVSPRRPCSTDILQLYAVLHAQGKGNVPGLRQGV